jgi:hypothetical protein
MAKEIKFISVSPSEVEEIVNLWQQCFGWELMGPPQEIKTQDVQLFTGQSDDGTEHYKTKPGEHYVKLTFERDPSSVPNYLEIVRLQKEYYSVPEPGNRSHLFSKLSLIVLAIGVIMIIAGANQFQFGLDPGTIVMVLLGSVIIFLRIFFHIRKNKRWDVDFSVYMKKREELAEKAKSLLH